MVSEEAELQAARSPQEEHVLTLQADVAVYRKAPVVLVVGLVEEEEAVAMAAM